MLLTFHGGPVMRTQNVHLIFWQARGWPAFPSGYMTAIQDWVTNVSADDGKGSNPFGAVAQYGGSNGAGAYNVHYGGSFSATDAPDQFARQHCTDGSICISEQSLVDEIDNVRRVEGWPLGMADQYAIILPPGVTTCDVTDACSDNVFCAYHSYYLTQQTDDPSTDAVFLTLPYEDPQGCHSSDGVNVRPEPNGQPDVLIGAMSHEMREATTDPHFDGWWNPNTQDESDDQCDTNYGLTIGPSGGFNQYINGHPYETQLEWSNALDGCYQMDPPTVTGMSTTTAAGGSHVTVTGTNLFASSINVVGALASSFSFSADGTSLDFVVPYTSSDGTVLVNTPAASIHATNSFVTGPGTSAIVPARATAGEVITLEGGNFTGANSVAFAGPGNPHGTIISSSLSLLNVTVPPTAVAGPITVTTHSGTVSGTSPMSFSPLPSITSLSTSAASIGSVVTVTGANFTANGPVSVSINGVTACQNCPATATTVRFPVPYTSSGHVTVTNGDGSVFSTAVLGVLPTINTVSGALIPGTQVTLSGGGFAGVTSVAFGDGTEPAQFTVNAPGTIIQAFVPTNATSGHIAVTTAAGTTMSPTALGAAPAISSFAPVSVQVGATVAISGSALDTADRVDFAGGVSATPTNVTGTSLQVVVPAGAQSGVFSVHTSSGSVSSGRPLTITFSASRFSPAKADYGATVTITGSALTGVTGVLFNGVPGTNVTVVDDSHVTVTVPASGSLTGQITVVKGGVSVHPSGFFTLFGLHSATPNAGPAGTTVVLSGVGFSAVSRVTFSGGVTAAFTVNSDTQITVTVPAGATNGRITVSVPGATASVPYSVT